MANQLARRCTILAAAALLVTVGAPPASAGTASTTPDGAVTYVAAPGEDNDLLVQDASAFASGVVLTESGSLGDESAGIDVSGSCLSLSSRRAVCFGLPFVGVTRVAVDVGDGAQNSVDVRSAVPASLAGGDGDDTLTGGDGNDALSAGGGTDRLSGGPGADDLQAGAGRDQLFGDEGDDVLVADPDGDDLTGGDGNDTLTGSDGEDHLTGDDGGSSGSSDVADADVLTGGGGVDVFDAGPGDDVLHADADAAADVLHCGDGRDGGAADLEDVVDDDCEDVTRPAPAGPPSDSGGPGAPSEPTRTSTPPTQPGDPFDVPLAPTPAPGPSRPSALPLLRPRPEVRIAGVLTVDGARVRVLQVRAPRGSLVRVRCSGTGCPVRSRRLVARGARRTGRMVTVRIRPLQRALRAGTVIEISVTQRGRTGKFTRLAIRRGKAPKRTDLCLRNHGRHPFACPA